MSLYLRQLLFELAEMVGSDTEIAAKARELVRQARDDGELERSLRPFGRFAPRGQLQETT